MQSLLTNWKTTALGLGAILAAAGHIATATGSGGSISATDVAAIFTGLMGLFASDAKS